MNAENTQRAAYLIPDQSTPVFEHFQPYLTPGGDAGWKDWELVLNPQGGRFDALVVSQSMQPLDRTYRLEVPPTRTLLMIKEPPGLLCLPDSYTDQFYSVVSQQRGVKCARPICAHSAHHWFLERPFLKITDVSDIAKTGLMSMVISSKQDTPGHRKRWRFANILRDHFGERLDWFGRGVQELQSKKDGVEPYRYHIVLENCAVPHYWTEKIADAFVGNSFPFYWGDPRIAADFPADALLRIDPDRPDECIAAIESAIEQDLYSQRQEALAEARRRLVAEHHPYEVYRRIWNSTPASAPSQVEIVPYSEFSYSATQQIRFRWRNLKRRLFSGHQN